ncbi:MAG: hypothetical protein QM739_15635 [Propionivibrio sp.]
MATTNKPAISTNVKAASSGESSGKKLVPVSPERGTSGTSVAKKRKRLAKAFPRPLDKQLRKQQMVREKFALPAFEYAQLLELKARLAEQGVPAKKSELVRAGLMLLAALDDDEVKSLLAGVPASA